MSFNKLGPILPTRSVSLRLKGKFYRMCVQRVKVYGSETWPMRVEATGGDAENGEDRENDDNDGCAK